MISRLFPLGLPLSHGQDLVTEHSPQHEDILRPWQDPKTVGVSQITKPRLSTAGASRLRTDRNLRYFALSQKFLDSLIALLW